MTGPILIGSEIYRGSTYGGKHPLAIPRVSAMLDLVAAMGWRDPACYRESPQASVEQLQRFHTPEYIAALAEAERTQQVSEAVRRRHRLGTDGNPIYREMFRRPATGAGAALLAAELTRHGGAVHAPGVGTHHGRPDRASGFCYLNDCVLGLMAWLDQGLTRILYVDIDAHHGDGVEDAFRDDPRVFTLSVHEAGRWPGTGEEHETAGGHAANLPVPEGFHDAEFDAVLHEAILPIAEALRPQAIMLQCGVDALAEDPLSRLALTNAAHRAAVRALAPLAPRFVVTGGGGYNPWAVARCWAAVWGALDRRDLPDRLPPEAEAVLRGVTWHRAAGRTPPDHWFTTLADPRARPQPVREEVVALARRVASRALSLIGQDS
jgi:acetoin utilization protein AcuC